MSCANTISSTSRNSLHYSRPANNAAKGNRISEEFKGVGQSDTEFNTPLQPLNGHSGLAKLINEGFKGKKNANASSNGDAQGDSGVSESSTTDSGTPRINLEATNKDPGHDANYDACRAKFFEDINGLMGSQELQQTILQTAKEDLIQAENIKGLDKFFATLDGVGCDKVAKQRVNDFLVMRKSLKDVALSSGNNEQLKILDKQTQTFVKMVNKHGLASNSPAAGSFHGSGKQAYLDFRNLCSCISASMATAGLDHNKQMAVQITNIIHQQPESSFKQELTNDLTSTLFREAISAYDAMVGCHKTEQGEVHMSGLLNMQLLAMDLFRREIARLVDHVTPPEDKPQPAPKANPDGDPSKVQPQAPVIHFNFTDNSTHHTDNSIHLTQQQAQDPSAPPSANATATQQQSVIPPSSMSIPEIPVTPKNDTPDNTEYQKRFVSTATIHLTPPVEKQETKPEMPEVKTAKVNTSFVVDESRLVTPFTGSGDIGLTPPLPGTELNNQKIITYIDRFNQSGGYLNGMGVSLRPDLYNSPGSRVTPDNQPSQAMGLVNAKVASAIPPERHTANTVSQRIHNDAVIMQSPPLVRRKNDATPDNTASITNTPIHKSDGMRQINPVAEQQPEKLRQRTYLDMQQDHLNVNKGAYQGGTGSSSWSGLYNSPGSRVTPDNQPSQAMGPANAKVASATPPERHTANTVSQRIHNDAVIMQSPPFVRQKNDVTPDNSASITNTPIHKSDGVRQTNPVAEQQPEKLQQRTYIDMQQDQLNAKSGKFIGGPGSAQRLDPFASSGLGRVTGNQHGYWGGKNTAKTASATPSRPQEPVDMPKNPASASINTRTETPYGEPKSPLTSLGDAIDTQSATQPKGNTTPADFGKRVGAIEHLFGAKRSQSANPSITNEVRMQSRQPAGGNPAVKGVTTTPPANDQATPRTSVADAVSLPTHNNAKGHSASVTADSHYKGPHWTGRTGASVKVDYINRVAKEKK